MNGTSGVTVTLYSHTQLPEETLYCVWQRSRDPTFRMDPDFVSIARETNPELDKQVKDIFAKVIETHLPVAEMIWFVFWIDNCPIALREQLVRHRIGTKINGVPDVDVIPDVPDSTWWAQGMRVMDMSTFASKGRYYVPQTIRDSDNPTVHETYERAMNMAEYSYEALTQLGIPREDARGVIPMHANHGLSWSLNLQSLKHIIGKRSCWILQIGQWQALLQGMVHELAEKVSPDFRKLINPPCMKGDTFNECLFKLDNERRITGDDEPPPCPLYLHHHNDEAQKRSETAANPSWYRLTPTSLSPHEEVNSGFVTVDTLQASSMDRQRAQYKELWVRDPDTGKPVDSV